MPSPQLVEQPARAHARPLTVHRRARRRRLAIGGVAIMLAAAVGVLVLGRPPAATGFDDPKVILDAAVGHLRGASAAHLVVDVSGTVSLGLFSDPMSAGMGPLSLAGTRFEGDVDLAHRGASVHFDVPALLGLTGTLVRLDGATYVTSSLTGVGWSRLDGNAGLPLDLADPLARIDALGGWLGSPGATPVKLDDVACRSGTCYQVLIDVPADRLSGLLAARANGSPTANGSESGSPSPGSTPPTAAMSILARIDRVSLRLTEAVLHIDLANDGALDVDLTFSAWDAPVTIETLPPDQIVDSSPSD